MRPEPIDFRVAKHCIRAWTRGRNHTATAKYIFPHLLWSHVPTRRFNWNNSSVRSRFLQHTHWQTLTWSLLALQPFLKWLHTLRSVKEAWDFSSRRKDKNKKSREGKWGCLDCSKIPGHYGIKSQPSNTELDQIDHLSRSAWGPAGEGRILFHKVRRLPAMQYSTEHNLQPSLHTEGHVSFPEPQKKKKIKKAKCQTCIHLKRSHGAEMQK